MPLFGDVIEVVGDADKIINQGQCGRYHDRASLDFSDGQAEISIVQCQSAVFALSVGYGRAAPEGSQASVPMTHEPFLVIVAPDEGGRPGHPQAFVTKPGQAVNYHRGIWHGVLTPLHGPGLFAVIDRIGQGDKLEEFWFDTPYEVVEG